MTELYNPTSADGPLRQGDILEGLIELRPDVSGSIVEVVASEHPPVERVRHPWAIILSPDCDLEWDFEARRGHAQAETKQVSHILLCDLEDESQIRAVRVKGNEQFRWAKGNRDERYHYLPQSRITASQDELAEYFIDFKRVFSLPTEYLLSVLNIGLVTRHGYLRPPWVQHLADRFTYFLGRVGLPDPQ